MADHRTCDGVARRDFLRAGAIGGSALTLANYLRWTHAAEATPRAKAAIFVNLEGGPSHLDTFDPKPDAPDTHRGEFKAINTTVPGVQISEHLPKLAATFDKYVILRGITHSLAAHPLGQQYVSTGNRPIPSLEFPSYGAVVSRELGGPEELPTHVAIPKINQSAGYLGVRYAALSTRSVPRAGQPYSVRGVSLTGTLTVDNVRRRQGLLRDLDRRLGWISLLNRRIRSSHRRERARPLTPALKALRSRSRSVRPILGRAVCWPRVWWSMVFLS
jgi:hypothetical protein